MKRFKRLTAAAVCGMLVLTAASVFADVPQPTPQPVSTPSPVVEDNSHHEEILDNNQHHEVPDAVINESVGETFEEATEGVPETTEETNQVSNEFRTHFEDILAGAAFLPFTGTVTEIIPVLSTNDGQPAHQQHYVRMQSEHYGTTIFRTDQNTFILGNPVDIGHTVTGWYAAGGEANMLYPPQHLARVIVNGEHKNVKIDRFFLDEARGTLVSSRRDLVLNFSMDTPVLQQSGARFFVSENSALLNELDGRLLVVTHSDIGSAIPGITMVSDPNLSITVLWDEADHMPDVIDLGFDPERTTNEGISVNKQKLDVTWKQINNTPYVPFRAIVDALGHGNAIQWDGHNLMVTAHNGTNVIAFPIDATHFIVGPNIVSLEHPAILEGGTTYVPWQFFRDVFDVNAWFNAGQVFVDEVYAMQ